MRANEFINENMSRRGFLGALGAGAMAASGAAKAGEFMQVGDFGLQRFVKEAEKLEARIKPIYQRLMAAAGPDAAKFKNIQVTADTVPMMAEYGDGKISFDVSVFYDLSDDTIAYKLGHELGHAYYGHRGYQGMTQQQAHNEELKADVYGARLAYKAGYNPKEAFNNFSAAMKKAKATATHPSYQTRKTNVQNQTGIPVATIQDLQHNMQAIRNSMAA
jgi:Zn-dependent protease with chaperone function